MHQKGAGTFPKKCGFVGKYRAGDYRSPARRKCDVIEKEREAAKGQCPGRYKPGQHPVFVKP